MGESIEEVVIDLGFAELVPVAGATRNLLGAGGSTSERTEITVTTGWSNTKTTEASLSVTASVGGSYGAANFSVSATVGFGYTDSTSLSKETSVKQVYQFRPGFITSYYQWGAHVKDKMILNGSVKLEAKSIDELQALKAKTETGASRVKLTLSKIVPPSGTFLIKSAASGYTLMCHSYGKGNCKMESITGSIYMPLTAEIVSKEENLYRFKNKESGYYIHCDKEGRGNVRLFRDQHNVCQIFRLVPTGTSDYFKLESYNADGYFMHSDNAGTGNVWMYSGKLDLPGRVLKFVKGGSKTKSFL